MKKIFCIAVLLITVNITSLMAQRHIKGIQGIELTGGYFGKGYFGSLAYTRYISSKFYIKLAYTSEMGRFITNDGTSNEQVKVPYKTQYLDCSFYYALFNIKDKIFISPTLGASGAYESLRELEYAPKQTGFLVGIAGGFETEFFLTDKFIFILEGKQRYYFLSELGTARYNVGGGFRYTF